MWADNETSDDMLGFQVHADLIHALVTDPVMLPTTIGLFGDWGSGKTSILKMLQTNLEGSSNKEDLKVLCLYFNGWLFEDYDDAKAALLDSIVQGLAANKKIFERIKDDLSTVMSSVNWMRVIRAGTKNIGLHTTIAALSGGATLPISLGAIGMDILDCAIVDQTSRGDEKSGESGCMRVAFRDVTMAVRDFRERFKSMLAKTKLDALVVLVDDLDRCTPQRIIASLEAIKLFLNVERTAFVIGADERIVKHAISATYSQNSGHANEDDQLVRDYLEKLVQVPYRIPCMSPAEVESYMVLLFCNRDLPKASFDECLKAFQSLRKADKYTTFGFVHVQKSLGKEEIGKSLRDSLVFCSKAAPLITECLKGNPRQIKRFLNAYVLRKQLADAACLDGLQDNVLLKLMILEYMDFERFRDLSDWQAAQDGYPVQVRTMEETLADCVDLKSALVEIEKVSKVWASEKLAKWLGLEPHLANVDLRDYFWIARDKLQTTLSGVILLSPVVRRILEDLVSGNDGRASAAAGQVPPLETGQRQDLLNALEKRIVTQPDDMHAYSALVRLENVGVDGAVLGLVRGLEQVAPSRIPKPVFPQMLLLESKPTTKAAVTGILVTLRKDTKVARFLMPRDTRKE